MRIILTFIIAIALFTLQNISFKQFSSNFMKTKSSYFIFNAIYFTLICILFAFMGINASLFTFSIVWLGLLFGISFIAAIFFYMKAMENGPLGLSFLFFSAGILIPIIFGIVFYQEPAPPHKIFGLMLLFAAFFISTRGSEGGGKMSKKWAIFILLASFNNGLIGLAQKLFNNFAPPEAVNEFLFMSFGQAAVISLAIGLVLMFLYKESAGHFKSRAFAFVAIITAIVTCFGNYIMVVLTMQVSAIVQYPVVSGSLVITSTLASWLVFKEKVTKKHIQAIALGFAAIVMLSI